MYLVVPKECTACDAAVWLATDESPPGPRTRVALVHPGGRTPVPPSWSAWSASPGFEVHHQEVQITGLAPRSYGGVTLEVAGRTRARARITTLPDGLPGAGEQPLTFLLGSCYCEANDASDAVEATYRRHLVGHLRPEFKILCGDQVYLDAPWRHFLRHRHSEREMREQFLARYLATWAGRGPGAGLQNLLKDGANFFSSDDHEFWNNAPSRATLVRDTWFERRRKIWLEVARQLYAIFQTRHPWHRFDVPPLHFYLADTRVKRDAGEVEFMPPVELRRLRTWLTNLGGPGVLVLGQPLFDTDHGPSGHLKDWSLPDFDQYADLVSAIHDVNHDVLVLTGDVHFRRYARCRLASGRTVHELISSPMTLVDKQARGEWASVPNFPLKPVAGTPAAPIETADFRGNADHVLVLQCHLVGAKVGVKVFDTAVGAMAPAPAKRPSLELELA